MKNIYSTPELDIVRFVTEDILNGSIEPDPDELPII